MNWFNLAALPSRPFTIGLVNNTPERAMRSTERQFLALVRAASGDPELRLRLFACSDFAPSAMPRGSSGEAYADLSALFRTRLDALIVTGMEPRARLLREEKVFGPIADIADWAEENAVPVIWSCLAAHAAVLHLDGVDRVRLPKKLSGVFACDVVAARHRTVSGLGTSWAVPHSRHYGLSETELTKSGYQILSRSDEVGVDLFTRVRRAPFLFLQGHPEYAGNTLLLEYRRDLRRFQAGETDTPPVMPANISETAAAVAGPWHATAAQFVANWLGTSAARGTRPRNEAAGFARGERAFG